MGLFATTLVALVMTWGELFDETDHLKVTVGDVREALRERREDAADA